jgi:hypothetical protein
MMVEENVEEIAEETVEEIVEIIVVGVDEVDTVVTDLTGVIDLTEVREVSTGEGEVDTVVVLVIAVVLVIVEVSVTVEEIEVDSVVVVEVSVVMINEEEEGMGELDIVVDSTVMVKFLPVDLQNSLQVLQLGLLVVDFRVISSVERIMFPLVVPLDLSLQNEIPLSNVGMMMAPIDGDLMIGVVNGIIIVIVIENKMEENVLTGMEIVVAVIDESTMDVMMIETKTETGIQNEGGINIVDD